MEILYDIGIRLYYVVVYLASPFNKKAKLWIRGRRGQFGRLKKDLEGVKSVVWIHCASLGEFEQGRPVIEKWKEFFPEDKLLLTFYSPSGYEIRKNYGAVDFVYYLPLDTRKNAKRFFDLVKPRYAIFIKYEFWHHFLFRARDSGTRLILISANFRPNQIFFKPYGKFYRDMLFCFDHVFVQDENSLRLVSRFEKLNVSIAGDTRFDRVKQIATESKKITIAERFATNRFTYVFGSTWVRDEEHIIRFINENKSKEVCFIIAPHEIENSHIKHLSDSLNKRSALFSRAHNEEIEKAGVLIIDNIGMLSSLYRYGHVAYIGGGFGRGIHNVLEPAVYGMPVIFGPKYTKFREAVELVREGGAFSVQSYLELNEILTHLHRNRKELQASAVATRQFVQRNLGATEVILNFLKNT